MQAISGEETNGGAFSKDEIAFIYDSYAALVADFLADYAAKYGEDGQEYRSAAEAEKLNNQVTDDKSSYFEGGLYIQPVLTYKISEHFRLETALNFLGFNLSGTTSKTITDDKGNWRKSNTCDFGLNINSENVAQIGYITIGWVYAF